MNKIPIQKLERDRRFEGVALKERLTSPVVETHKTVNDMLFLLEVVVPAMLEVQRGNADESNKRTNLLKKVTDELQAFLWTEECNMKTGAGQELKAYAQNIVYSARALITCVKT